MDKKLWVLALVTSLSGVATSWSQVAWADPNLPSGFDPALSSGVTSVVNTGTTQTITTNSKNSLGSFNTFNIGSGYTVNVSQPTSSSTFMGLVRSGSPTSIYGNLDSNGSVGLINSAGIYVGPTGAVNTNGFLGSTQQLNESRYLNTGQIELSSSAPQLEGGVTNDGSIRVGNEGFILLSSGKQVTNNGTIEAPNGEISLVSSDRVNLTTLDGVNLRLDRTPSLNPGDPLFSGIVNNTGKLDVNGTYTQQSGAITLLAPNGKINFTGSALANTGAPSSIDLLADEITLAGQLSANTSNGDGGQIRIGGDYQGQLNGETINATNTVITETTSIQANALASGDGGTVIAWADDVTRVAGSFEAKGGASGNGGLVETSGKVSLAVESSTIINTTAVNGETGTWLLDPEDLTIANSGGDITPTTIETNLASNNVSITTNNTSGSEAGDIFINDAVNWSNGNSLTLNAYRNIDVNAAITNSGSGNLVLRSDSMGTGTGTINFGGSGSLSLTSGRVDLYYNPISYNSPIDYSGNITGTHTAWMLVHDVNDLQSMSTNLAGYYALSQDIDASVTSTWNSGAGFDPVGSNSQRFTGKLDGQNFTITDLKMNYTSSHTGLLGYTDGAVIQNIHLAELDIVGNGRVGGLIGTSTNTQLSNVSTSGTVQGSSNIGGLIGFASNNTRIDNSFSNANVNATNNNVGGLVGRLNNGSIYDSYASLRIIGSGDNYGGLVGYSDGSTITLSYSNSDISGKANIGGLLGLAQNSTTVSKAYSLGNVTATQSQVGGLVGSASNLNVSDSYSTSSVSGQNNVGGLVGLLNNSSVVTRGYASGAISVSGSFGGGVVGRSLGGSLTTSSYWNTETSGLSISAGGSGLTTIQMQQASSFTGFDIATEGGSSVAWRIYEGVTNPLLRSFMMALDVSITPGLSLNQGESFSASNLIFSGFANGDTVSTLLGSVSIPNVPDSPGIYSITPSGIFSNQQGYDIRFLSGITTRLGSPTPINPSPALTPQLLPLLIAPLVNGAPTSPVSAASVALPVRNTTSLTPSLPAPDLVQVASSRSIKQVQKTTSLTESPAFGSQSPSGHPERSEVSTDPLVLNQELPDFSLLTLPRNETPDALVSTLKEKEGRQEFFYSLGSSYRPSLNNFSQRTPRFNLDRLDGNRTPDNVLSDLLQKNLQVDWKYAALNKTSDIVSLPSIHRTSTQIQLMGTTFSDRLSSDFEILYNDNAIGFVTDYDHMSSLTGEQTTKEWNVNLLDANLYGSVDALVEGAASG